MPFLDFGRAQRALHSGETSCEKLVSFFLDRIRSRNEELNAFVSVFDEAAPKRARQVDEQLKRGDALPLAGLILAVKDVICMAGERVSCSSRMLDHFESLYDATAVARLERAGAIVVGKTNCDEFAMGSSNENSYFGPVRNPVDTARVPGGSSGGSAAAVAAGLCHAALGTDTGGSIRQPASFCGVVGLKPTYGRVSRFGLVAYASSFDCMGPFAGDVQTVAAVMSVMSGADEHDGTSADMEVPQFESSIGQSINGLRIGVPDDFFGEGLDRETETVVRSAISRLQTMGATVVPIHLPHTRYGIATYYVLTTAEASSNLARYDGVRYGFRADPETIERREAEWRLAWERRRDQADNSDEREAAEAILSKTMSPLESMYVHTRSEGFGDEVKRRIMLGTYVLSSGYYDAYYGRAQRVRTLIRQDFENAFQKCDVIATPTAPTPAFPLGSMEGDPLAMYLSDIYTVTANLAGIPGISVPVGESSEGLPIGLQLLGSWFDEERLLAASAALTGALTGAISTD